MILRIYLLAGLVFHKAVWEVLKRRQGGGPAASPEPLTWSFRTFTKLVKIGILAGILAQTVLPEILPVGGDPAPRRAIGAGLYTLGLAIAVLGRWQLGGNWSDIEAAGVLPAQRVVEAGLYRYVRHPIYVGDLLLLAGLELALNSWLVAGVLLLTPVVLRQAIKEEGMLRQTLAGYEEYCRRSKRFVPLLW